MKKVSSRRLIIIFASLLLVSLAWMALQRLLPRNALIAEVYSDGRLVHTVDLNKVREPYIFELPHNRVLVEHGQISMHEADCPDHLCVKQGKISGGAYPIVCLPNRVMIRITGGGGVDAVAGR